MNAGRSRKNWRGKQIVAKLRQIKVKLAQGKSLALACKVAEFVIGE